MAHERARRLRHLHEAQGTFLHARPAARRDNQKRKPPRRRRLDQPRDLLADGGSHARAHETEIHDCDADGMVADAARPADDRFVKSRLPTGFHQFFRIAAVVAEVQEIHGSHIRVHLLERAEIHQQGDPLVRAQRMMVAAVRADLEIAVQRPLAQFLFAVLALHHPAGRNVRRDRFNRYLYFFFSLFHIPNIQMGVFCHKSRAIVSTLTDDAPPSSKASVAAFNVEPVVKTSSRRSRRRPAGLILHTKAWRTLRCRSSLFILACCRVRRVRLRQEIFGNPSRLPSRSASTSVWL